MKTYAELKAELNAAKKSIKEEIVAVIVQAGKPVTAREIAAQLNGVTIMEVSAFLNNARDDLNILARPFGVRIYDREEYVNRTYFAVDNPSDILNVKRNVLTYYAARI